MEKTEFSTEFLFPIIENGYKMYIREYLGTDSASNSLFKIHFFKSFETGLVVLAQMIVNGVDCTESQDREILYEMASGVTCCKFYFSPEILEPLS